MLYALQLKEVQKKKKINKPLIPCDNKKPKLSSVCRAYDKDIFFNAVTFLIYCTVPSGTVQGLTQSTALDPYLFDKSPRPKMILRTSDPRIFSKLRILAYYILVSTNNYYCVSGNIGLIPYMSIRVPSGVLKLYHLMELPQRMCLQVFCPALLCYNSIAYFFFDSLLSCTYHPLGDSALPLDQEEIFVF